VPESETEVRFISPIVEAHVLARAALRRVRADLAARWPWQRRTDAWTAHWPGNYPLSVPVA